MKPLRITILFIIILSLSIFLAAPFFRISANVVSGKYLIKVDNNFDLNSIQYNEINNPKNSNGKWLELNIKNGADLEALRNNSHVLNIQKEVKYQTTDNPDDPYYNEFGGVPPFTDKYDQWNLRVIGLNPTSGTSGWNNSTGDNGTIVAVIDTGIDLGNEDLQNNLWTNLGETPGNSIDDDGNGYVDDVNGWNFVSNSNDIQDVVVSGNGKGHGSHVSGIIAADSNNLKGVAGVCWNCKLMILNVFDTNSTTNDAIVYNAIIYAVDNGAKVINMSIEGGGYSQNMQDAVDYAWSHGVLVVVAAGNDGDDASYYSPAGLSHVITVGASDQNDTSIAYDPITCNSLVCFSNYGQKLDLIAPGYNILSTWLHTLPNTSCVGDTNYFCLSGTSMSTPHVAGVAALIYDLHPGWDNLDVRNALLKEADDKGAAGFDSLDGFGRVNAYNSLENGTSVSGITSPTVTLNTPANLYFSDNITLNGTVNADDLYIYNLKFENSGNTVYLYSGRGSTDNSELINQDVGLSEGDYDVTLSAEDFNGAVSSTTPLTIHVDLTPPSSFTIGAQTSNTSVTLTFSTTDSLSGISHYEVSMDSGTYHTKTSPYIVTNLSDGSHTAHVKAYDNAGNVKQVDKTFTITSENYILESSGDFNHDDDVDLSDLSILASNWNKNSNNGDANHDGIVDLSDLSILALNWNKTL